MKRLENKGITLVALVVTIIVLIILAGVSISLVLGQDGVVQKAKTGRDNYADAARLENEQLANVDAFAMDIEAMIPSSPSESQGTATGTITDITGGDLDISATVSLTSQGRTEIDFENTKYVFTTSSDPLGVTDSSLYSDGTITEANATITKSKKAGTYYLHVLLAEKNGNKQEIISEQTATSVGKKDFDYTGNTQDITLIPGNYKLEVWGARGGQGADSTTSNTSWTYGKGGYSYGNLSLNSQTKIYAYVGGTGKGVNGSSVSSNSRVAGGFNGGGNTYHDGGEFGGSGGGATDFRIDSNSLYARIIVAGGGGGCGEDNEEAGYGGGTSSGSGSSSNYMATQTAAGSNGSFGQGANYANANESGGGGRRRLVRRWPVVKVLAQEEDLDGYLQNLHIIHGKMEIQQMQINIY